MGIGIPSFDRLTPDEKFVVTLHMESGLREDLAFARYWAEKARKWSHSSKARQLRKWRANANIQLAIRDMVNARASKAVNVSDRREEVGAKALEVFDEAIEVLAARGLDNLDNKELVGILRDAVKQLSDKQRDDMSERVSKVADAGKLDNILNEVAEKSDIQPRFPTEPDDTGEGNNNNQE